MRFKNKFRAIVKAKKSFKMSEIAEDFETSLSQLCNRALLSIKASIWVLRVLYNKLFKSVEQGLSFFHSKE